MKWFCFLFLCIHTFEQANAQQAKELNLTLNKTITLNATAFYGVDEIGTLFYSAENVFYKKTSTQTLEFYDILLGTLTSVDLINPMNAMLFYRESQTVVFLDNRLNETQRVQFNDLEPYRYIQFASVAGEQQLWLFNLDEQRLERYDILNNRFLPFLQNVKEPIINMVSTYNFCHLKTATQLQSFNSYGSLINTMELHNATTVTTSFKQIIVLKESELEVWSQNKNASFFKSHVTTKLPETFFIDRNPVQSLYLKAGKLYIYSRNRISVYDTNLLN